MNQNTRIAIFILTIFSFFSISFAEDFWMKLNFSEPCSRIFYTIQDEIYITMLGSPNYLYRSLDKGMTWENYSEVLNYPFYVPDLAHISEDGNYLYMFANDTLRTTHKDSANFKSFFEMSWARKMVKCRGYFYFLQNGIIWKADENLKDTTTVLYTNPSSEGFFALVADSTGSLYAGSTNFISEGGLYKSCDNGDTWLGPGPDLLNDYISAMVVDSAGRIFVGTTGHATLGGGRIYRSVDNGNSWQKVAGNGTYVKSMTINNDNEIFAGLSDDWGFLGIAHSNDHGETWAFLNEGLGGASSGGGAGEIKDMAISPDGYIYLATDGGVYRSVNSTTGIEERDSEIVSGFELYQNYPNPFNNITVVSFNLLDRGEIKLDILNSKGQEVNNIFNGMKEKGKHVFHYVMDKNNSGIYFCRLSYNGKPVTKRMIYIK